MGEMLSISLTDCSYLAEGNANIVFTKAELDKVIRLRKMPQNGHSSTSPRVTSVDIVDYYEKRNRSLFADENLVHHELVLISTTDIRVLNNLLSTMEENGQRPLSRIGSRLDETETHGILMTPMVKR